MDVSYGLSRIMEVWYSSFEFIIIAIGIIVAMAILLYHYKPWEE